MAPLPSVTRVGIDMDLIERFDNAMAAFHDALAGRLRKVQQTSGNPLEVEIQISTYVIPGFHYQVHADQGQTYMIWIGANFKRLFFITRLNVDVEKAKEVFRFTFGGAEAVGWHMNYEPVGDGEVSIWATRLCDEPLVLENDKQEEHVALTKSGAFWAIDIGMMVQSMIRTAQRNQIKPSPILPEPL
jgi:hypothetical protein